jgi:PKD repeat protein
LNVTDSEGEWDTETKIMKVVQSPTANFTTTYHSSRVTFNASSSYDPDGYIMSYNWDFGDGSTSADIVPVVTHNYTKPGTYNVTLTVIDNDDLTNSVKNSLTIKTLLGDLNSDGILNILDITIVAKAFGSFPGHSRWDPIADLNEDGKVDILDIAKIAKNFGKTC